MLRPNDANNFSFHYAVRCNSKQIVTFFRRVFDPKDLRLCCLRKDSEGVEPLFRARKEASKEMVSLLEPILQEIDFGKNMEIVQEASSSVEANLNKYYARVESIRVNFESDMDETQKKIQELKAKQRELDSQKEEEENLKRLKARAKAKTRSQVVVMGSSKKEKEDYDHFFDMEKDSFQEEEEEKSEASIEEKPEEKGNQMTSLLLGQNTIKTQEVALFYFLNPYESRSSNTKKQGKNWKRKRGKLKRFAKKLSSKRGK